MKFITFLVLLSLSLYNLAGNEIEVVFGVSRPPFIMETERTGICYELFNYIADKIGIEFSPIFASNARMEYKMKTGDFDIIVEVQKSESNYFYSAPFIAYRNFAVYKGTDNFYFSGYSDLHGKSVCAWQNANENLGDSFASQIPKFRKYKEFPLQEVQVKNWMLGIFEVIIIDDTLLKWWIKKLVPELEGYNRKVDLSNIQYNPLPDGNELWWYVVFKDKTLRDQFNAILEKIIKDGEYDRIREGFVNQYKNK